MVSDAEFTDKVVIVACVIVAFVKEALSPKIFWTKVSPEMFVVEEVIFVVDEFI